MAMASRHKSSRLRSVLAVAPVVALGVFLTLVAAYTVQRRADDVGERSFRQQSDIISESIERQIERHVEAVEDTTAFAEATWPGDIHEWRAYITERVQSDDYLAFSSSPGLVERVPVAEHAAFEAREAESSGVPFAVVGAAAPGADLLVLTRTAVDAADNGIPIRGLEAGGTIAALGLEIPTVEEGLVLRSLANAPEVVFDVLGMNTDEVDLGPVEGTDVIFVEAVGDVGSEPLGWVVIPAQLGELLESVVPESSDRVNITVGVPGLDIDGDLARLEKLEGLSVDDAAYAFHRDYEVGGQIWQVAIWADGSFGIGDTIDRSEVLLVGFVITLALAALIYGRRRHRLKLDHAEFELSLQRTLTATDSLTGLLNREGLSSRFDGATDESGTAVLFLDIDRFKLINDGMGHAAGDRTLVQLAVAIRSAARDGDLVARLGGDEFIVVCPGVGDADAARQIAHRFESAITSIGGSPPLLVSIGVAVARAGRPTCLQTLIHTADKAMYEAKRAGGARILVSGALEPIETQSV
jgi:diguanylate cyclase (GGDEF)-like protein